MKTNLLQRMHAGEAVLGTFMKLAEPAVVEIFGLTGFDYVILDMEHGPNSFETLQNLVRAAELRGLVPVVRVYGNEPGLIQRALDLGAKGVQVPQINTQADAERLVKAAKFMPAGERGLCRYVRAAQYTSRDKQEYFSQSNEEIMTIGHIEGIEGVMNLDQILKVGLDVVFIGPYDLSSSLGIPGQVDNPLVVEKIKEICVKATAEGVLLGTFADTLEKARFYRELGIRYISLSVDVGIISDAARALVDAFHQGEGR